MNKINQFETILNNAYGIVKENLGEKENLLTEKKELIESLNQDNLIKISIVGDFSAGKSTLINALLGVNILPTDITPETAVSYELFFDTRERLELYRNFELIQTYDISQIKSFTVKPGDIVKVFINNSKVKEWNDKGILIVDMPGIDSGIKEHNDAIMNYIADGTVFVVAVDVEQGTLRESSISFLKEIKQYNLSSIVVITKTDKKPESEVSSVKELISKQVKVVVGEQTSVVTTSSVNKDIKDFEDVLLDLNVEEIITQKYGATVNNYIDKIIDTIQTELKLLSIDKTKFEEKKQHISDSFNKAISNLEEKKKKLQSVEDSANDVLEDIESSLKNNSRSLAITLFNNSKDNNAFSAYVMSIVRPVIINSLGREQQEYINGLSSVVENFKINIDSITFSEDNGLYNKLVPVVNDSAITNTIQNLVKKQVSKLVAKVGTKSAASALLGGISAFVASPVMGIIVGFLTEGILSLFKKSDKSKIDDVETKVVNEIIPNIILRLRPNIEEVILKQQDAIVQAVEDTIEDEKSKLDTEISKIEKEEQKTEEEFEVIVQKYKNAINSLENKKN